MTWPFLQTMRDPGSRAGQWGQGLIAKQRDPVWLLRHVLWIIF